MLVGGRKVRRHSEAKRSPFRFVDEYQIRRTKHKVVAKAKGAIEEECRSRVAAFLGEQTI